MNVKNPKPLALAALSLASALALAVTSKPCESGAATMCTGAGNGVQCGGSNVIAITDPEPKAVYYCGGNSESRCADGDGTKCSELFYKIGNARHITCGATDLGWCFSGSFQSPVPTGYDCGYQPCDDVPPGERQQPNIQGQMARCGLQFGVYQLTEACEGPDDDQPPQGG